VLKNKKERIRSMEYKKLVAQNALGFYGDDHSVVTTVGFVASGGARAEARGNTDGYPYCKARVYSTCPKGKKDWSEPRIKLSGKGFGLSGVIEPFDIEVQLDEVHNWVKAIEAARKNWDEHSAELTKDG